MHVYLRMQDVYHVCLVLEMHADSEHIQGRLFVDAGGHACMDLCIFLRSTHLNPTKYPL
jgi:hypothetical protein